MSLAHKPSTPAKPIFIDAPKCYMCTLTDGDASPRWAWWFDQPEVQESLNLAPRKNTKANIISTNTAIRNYLHKTGWTLDKTLKGHVKSHVDGSMLDLCCYSITREAWHAWRAANLSPASSAT